MVREAVRQFFAERGFGPCRVLAAVSGGVDSTALLVALASLRGDGLEIAAAHVNHHLRGAESDGDEAFVRDLCERLGVPLQVLDGTLDAATVGSRGVEAAAREVRYRCLVEAAEGRLIATAHQQNDQAETILMRLITGSGLAGMRGILPVREDGVIRPLLGVARTEIVSFLAAEGITPRQDRSNDDPRFLRNRIRASLPADCAPLAKVAAEAQRWWFWQELVLDSAERAMLEATAEETRFLRLPDSPWLRRALLHRHIRRLDPTARDVSAADLTRLSGQLETVRRTTVTRELELARQGDVVVLRRRNRPNLPVQGVTVHLSAGAAPPHAQPFQLPVGGLPPRFTVRNRRPGDRFQPLGMRNSKKLKDFLIDRKIAARVRDRLPLLLCNDEIVWVAGVEISERFKVRDPPGGTLYHVWMEDSGGPGERDQSPLQR